jgi:hypothetical protein
MVKASATGAIDFAHSDLRDMYWWRKLRWTIDAISREDDYRLTEAQHRHWVTVFANSSLDADGFELAKANAQDYLHKLIIARYPEFASQLAMANRAASREGVVEEFRERFGYPGDPRYEAMLLRTLDAFRQLREQDDSQHNRAA